MRTRFHLWEQTGRWFDRILLTQLKIWSRPTFCILSWCCFSGILLWTFDSKIYFSSWGNVLFLYHTLNILSGTTKHFRRVIQFHGLLGLDVLQFHGLLVFKSKLLNFWRIFTTLCVFLLFFWDFEPNWWNYWLLILYLRFLIEYWCLNFWTLWPIKFLHTFSEVLLYINSSFASFQQSAEPR